MIILFILLHFPSIYFLAPRYLQISCVLLQEYWKYILKKGVFEMEYALQVKMRIESKDLPGFKNGVGRAVFVLLVTGNIQYLPMRRPAKELLDFRIIFNDPFLML